VDDLVIAVVPQFHWIPAISYHHSFPFFTWNNCKKSHPLQLQEPIYVKFLPRCRSIYIMLHIISTQSQGMLCVCRIWGPLSTVAEDLVFWDILLMSTGKQHWIFWMIIMHYKSPLVDQWLVCSPLDPRFAGSIPTEVDGFLRVIKIRSTPSFGGEVNPSVPCRRFTACKRTLRAWIKMLRKPNCLHFSPKSPDCLPEPSGRHIRIDRTVSAASWPVTNCHECARLSNLE
jgi:hypothetical protein